MQSYKAASLTIFDAGVLVVFADASVDQKTLEQRQLACTALQHSLEQSDPEIDSVLVWEDAAGRMKFMCSPRQERFFQIMRYDQLLAQADRTVTFLLPG